MRKNTKVDNGKRRLPGSVGRILLCLVPFLATAPCIFSALIPVGFRLILLAHICLYFGYALTLLGDRMTGQKFDWPRFVLALLTWLVLAIMGPLAAGAAWAASR